MKHIIMVGSQHGNEVLGDKLFAYIQANRRDLLPNTRFIIGNPRAHKLGVRYIESDLNRSYNGRSGTYEERRAALILARIKEYNPALVLDLHTTTTDRNPPCIITASPNHEFVKYSNIDKIVHMNNPIVDNSLIGRCPQAISIEIHENEIDDTFLGTLCDDIKRFLADKPLADTKFVYEADDLLRKSEISEADVAKLENFKMSKHGFYPILVGENSYKKQTEYLGFRAQKMYEVRYNGH